MTNNTLASILSPNILRPAVDPTQTVTYARCCCRLPLHVAMPLDFTYAGPHSSHVVSSPAGSLPHYPSHDAAPRES